MNKEARGKKVNREVEEKLESYGVIGVKGEMFQEEYGSNCVESC